jgi:hypothetical protein
VSRFLLPRAVRQDDRFALACALLTLIVAGFLWLFVGGAAVF